MSEQFTFFYRSTSPFSQWYPNAPFFKYGLRFQHAENFMMWRKGMLFGAEQSLLDQMRTAAPDVAKRLGRDVPNFNPEIWKIAAKPLVAEGNYAKFSQNPAALKAMLATHGTTLVEASPSDTIWGIGLRSDDSRAWKRETWRGTNWLGEILTDICNVFMLARNTEL